MKKLIFFLFFTSVVAYSQGSFSGQQTLIDSQGHPLGGATLTTFSDSVCSIPVNTWTNQALTLPSVGGQANFNADGLGNFSFWAPPSSVFYKVSGVNVSGSSCFLVTLPVVIGSSPVFVTVTASGGFIGNLTGNVTGNLTGNVSGNVTGNLTGNVSGATTIISATANPAQSGFIRLASPDVIAWRNNANGADILISKSGAATANTPADTLNLAGFGGVKNPESFFSGPNPYYDIRSYNAACDGVTDDTTAINAALTAANAAGGGWVVIPNNKVCVVAGQLVMDQMVNVGLVGLAGAAMTNTTSPILKFTGSTTPLIKARSSFGLRFQSVVLQYNNAAMSGRFLDTERVTGNDSQNLRFVDMAIEGTGSGTGATCLLCLDNTDISVVSGVQFYNAVHAISAPSATGLIIKDSSFSSSAGGITGAYISEFGPATKIQTSNFEMGNNVSAISCTICSSNGSSIEDNIFEDYVAGYNATLLNLNFVTFTIRGNIASPGPGSTSIFLGSNGNPIATIDSNFLGAWGTAFAFSGGGALKLDIGAGNHYNGAITTFLSGPPTQSGRVVDNNGVVRTFSAFCTSAGGTCGANTSGFFTIATGVTTATVSTTNVTANSQITISENTTKGGALSVTCNTVAGRTYAVTTITGGTSFVVTASAAPAANPACLSYSIIN